MVYTVAELKRFKFATASLSASWGREVESTMTLLLDEVEPYFEKPYPDDASSLRESLKLIDMYVGRICFRRANAETFYKISYLSKVAEYSKKAGIKADKVKKQAEKDSIPVMYLMALCERAWESLREKKSVLQSLLAMEREGMPKGSMYPQGLKNPYDSVRGKP